MDIKSATKFLGNSQFKQLCHITSELLEVIIAWIVYNLNPTYENFYKLLAEIVDLQSSCQTMLEGPLKQSKCQITLIRLNVEVKNDRRKYYAKS